VHAQNTRRVIPRTATPGELIHAHCADILSSPGMQVERACIQHGDTSVLEHSVAVTAHCAIIARTLRIPVDERALMRGALLHDYFLYDWHDRTTSRPHHATRHGSYARANAERDFAITDHEGDIIQSHMFPLEGFPRTREAWVLCLVDKGVSLAETLAGIKERIVRRG
jgi:uncharacterized protein